MSQLKQISLKEVAEHKTSESCWIVINDKVYDVTKFLDEHPGGEEVILEQSGSYATEPFEDVGHSTDAREMMAEYLIGEIIEKEPKSNLLSVGPGSKQSGFGGILGLAIPLGVVIAALITYFYFF